ncbi:MAG: TIM44-like domain-containing protein [Clostridia bacterium]|jgi:hypothetical protein|nr:TIM44-like domain-containing protein [Clostridia bacterium]
MKLGVKLRNVVLIALILVFGYCNITFASDRNKDDRIADVGSFESYDSSSSSSSSSSWDYDDYDYDYGSSSSSRRYRSSSSSSSGFDVFFLFFAFGIIIIIAYYANKHKGNFVMPLKTVNNTGINADEAGVEAKVKATDPMFNKEEFLAFARSVFIKLQEAWTARDWSIIRPFESNELFEQHQKQLQGYIDNNQINVMERICVKDIKLSHFAQVGDKDVLKVVLSSKMVDYIIDATTQKVLKGDKVTDRHSTYQLTFIRKTGVKTKVGTSEVNTTNCPNCGAPTQITSSGKCEYCGSVITTGEYNWVLSDLTKLY